MWRDLAGTRQANCDVQSIDGCQLRSDTVPPTAETLQASTQRLKSTLDKLDADTATVTDEVRIAVVRELWAYWYKSGAVLFDGAVGRYEAEAKVRLEQRKREILEA